MTTAFFCVIKAWRAHEGELRGYLTHRLGNNNLAEDMLQEVFIKAMRQGASFCSLDNTRAWLFQVARNALVDYQRLYRETAELPDDIPEPNEQTEPIVALVECVGRVLTELSPEDRDIIEQCDLNGMKQQAYADANDLTLPAVKSRLLRARKKMRETLSTNCPTIRHGVQYSGTGHTAFRRATSKAHIMTLQLESLLTCPACGHAELLTVGVTQRIPSGVGAIASQKIRMYGCNLYLLSKSLIESLAKVGVQV